MEYYEDMLETVSVHSSSSSESATVPETKNKKNNKKKTSSKKKKEEKPVYFKSNSVGRRIVYGDTGVMTPHVVGSCEEDLYFKVNYTAYKFENDNTILFYDNPMDYCIHYYTQLCRNKHIKNEEPEQLKERIDKMYNEMVASGVVDTWRAKRDNMLYYLRREREHEEERKTVEVK